MNLKKNLGISIGVLALAAIGAAQDIKVRVNDQLVSFPNGQPQEVGSRVLVPLRGVFEEMGAYVIWDPGSKTVTASRGSTDVKLTIGQHWATVNGQRVNMDTPAMLIDASTMVPIRFVSEALGAKVGWNESNQTVRITADAIGDKHSGGPPYNPRPTRPNPPPPPPPNRPMPPARYSIPAGTVIPVSLMTQISSATSRRGDTVWGRIDGFNMGPRRAGAWDFDFPAGSRIQGQITSSIRRQGNRPGLLELSFTRIVLPNNTSFPIRGSLISLDSRYVMRNSNGVYQVTADGRNNRMIFAGYGAAAGLLIGLNNNKPLESLAAGGVLGYLAGSLAGDQRQPRDFTILPGAKMGVRLNSAIVVMLPPR